MALASPIVLQGGSRAQPGLAWSPDGAMLVTTGDENQLLLWNAGGDFLRSVAAPAPPCAGLAFSADGSRVATAIGDGTICMWETKTGHPLPIICDPAFDSTVLAWSPDRAMLACAAGNGVRIWDSYTGQPKRVLQTSHQAFCISWSPDSRLIAIAGDSPYIGVWNATGGMRKRFTTHAQEVFSLAWSRDGRYLATGGDNSYIYIWDVANSDASAILGGHADSVVALDFSFDGKYLASKSLDGTLQIWDRERNSDPLLVIREGAARNDRFPTVAFHPTAYIVAGAESPGGRIRLRPVREDRTPPDGPRTADDPEAAPLVAGRPIRLFVSYSHNDRELIKHLHPYLEKMQQDGLIEAWSDRNILPGDDWQKAIDERLNSAQIVVLLITQEFLISKYCQSIEVERALQLRKEGKACVIPVLMEAADWENDKIHRLQILPDDAKPVMSAGNTKEALLNVSRGIRKVVEELQRNRYQRK
jgi:WD40 repeat protein